MSMILIGVISVHFPISIFVVVEENEYTLGSVRYHFIFTFDSAATHQSDGPGVSLVSVLSILLDVY